MITIQQLNRITPCDVKLKGKKSIRRCEYIAPHTGILCLKFAEEKDLSIVHFKDIESIHLKTFDDITKEDLHQLNLLRDGLTAYNIKEFELMFTDTVLRNEVSFHNHKVAQDNSRHKIIRYKDGSSNWFGIDSLQDKQLNTTQVMWLIDNNFDYFDLMKTQNGKTK